MMRCLLEEDTLELRRLVGFANRLAAELAACSAESGRLCDLPN
jgi:hypothetical protein